MKNKKGWQAVPAPDSNHPADIKQASHILSKATCLGKGVRVGTQILAIVSTTDVIKPFDMPDPRIGCPHLMKSVLATNGCPFSGCWCFLKLTYRKAPDHSVEEKKK